MRVRPWWKIRRLSYIKISIFPMLQSSVVRFFIPLTVDKFSTFWCDRKNSQTSCRYDLRIAAMPRQFLWKNLRERRLRGEHINEAQYHQVVRCCRARYSQPLRKRSGRWPRKTRRRPPRSVPRSARTSRRLMPETWTSWFRTGHHRVSTSVGNTGERVIGHEALAVEFTAMFADSGNSKTGRYDRIDWVDLTKCRVGTRHRYSDSGRGWCHPEQLQCCVREVR